MKHGGLLVGGLLLSAVAIADGCNTAVTQANITPCYAAVYKTQERAKWSKRPRECGARRVLPRSRPD